MGVPAERRELDQLALLKLWGCGDDLLTLGGEVTALLEHGGGSVECGEHGVDRCGGCWGVGDRRDEQSLELLRTGDSTSRLAGLDNPTSSELTRQLLGWEPTHVG